MRGCLRWASGDEIDYLKQKSGANRDDKLRDLIVDVELLKHFGDGLSATDVTRTAKRGLRHCLKQI